MRILGIDLGTYEVKVVLMEGNNVIDMKKYSTISFYRNYCEYGDKIMINIEKLNVGEIDYAVSTGYVNDNKNLKEFIGIDELEAHAYGAIYQSGIDDFILLDVGNQNIKVQKVEKSIVKKIDFHIDAIEFNSICKIFNESEPIKKISEEYNKEDLYKNINKFLYKKLLPLLSKFPENKFIISGGIANNEIFYQYFKEKFDKIIKLKEPQYNGAIGCCYYGMNILEKSN